MRYWVASPRKFVKSTWYSVPYSRSLQSKSATQPHSRQRAVSEWTSSALYPVSTSEKPRMRSSIGIAGISRRG